MYLIGNCIIGQNLNFEAGSICANHFNQRQEKEIIVQHGNQITKTKVTKFSGLVGDRSKIGTNAVSILDKNSIVNRLELIDQMKNQ